MTIPPLHIPRPPLEELERLAAAQLETMKAMLLQLKHIRAALESMAQPQKTEG